MTNQGKILIVEDEIKWQKSLRSLLEREGFSVDVAGAYHEAVRNLKEKIYHLLVLDIRLVDKDPSNVEGMDLLRNLIPQKSLGSLGIIILSSYGTSSQMREAFSRYGVNDFQDKKKFDKNEFIERIYSTFSEKVKINLNLSINWTAGGDAEKATANLRFSDNTSLKKKSPNFQKLIADEFEDLIKRLFYNSESVLLKPLRGGRSNSQVLQSTPFDSKLGAGASFAVKFGDIESIKAESENFEEYVNKYLEGGRHTSIKDVRFNQNLGGIVYKFLGTSVENLVSFGDFYHRASISEVADLLESLFKETCYSWYKKPGVERPLNLTYEYLTSVNLTKEKLESYLKEIKISKNGDGDLLFKAPGEEFLFINPISAFMNNDFTVATRQSIVHGDLHSGNILVDKSNKPWLIDFGNTKLGHILCDFIVLDSAIRFHLLSTEQASLKERIYLETALSKIGNAAQLADAADSFQSDNQYISKTFSTILRLRAIALQLLPNLRSDFSEYQLSLLLYALSSIRFTSTLETAQRQHALLSACLLAENLKQRGVYG